MPLKPFRLTFSYTPKWKNNRDRDAADQIHVVMRDLQESRRIVEQERMFKALSDREKQEEVKPLAERKMGGEWLVTIKGEQISLAYDVVGRHLVSFDSFQVEDDQGQTREVKTFEEMTEHASDLAAELFNRLINGPDLDELKN